MFESHLAGSALDGMNGSDGVGGDGVGTDPNDWMTQAVSDAGGIARTLVGRGIEEITGTPATPASAPQGAEIPTQPINTIPATNPNAVVPTPVSTTGPNKLLLFGGLAAVGLVGWLWYTGKIGGRKRRRR